MSPALDAPITVIRGRIYGAILGDYGEKYYLAVSNNRRNRQLPSFLAIRLTTTPKPELDSIVRLTPADEPWTGCLLADDVVEIYSDEVTREMGALRPATMLKVNEALKIAFALP